MSGVQNIRSVTYVERYWTWDSRGDCWVRNERRHGPILQQYRNGAWYNVDSVEIVTSDPPKPED